MDERTQPVYLKPDTYERFWQFPIGGKFATDRMAYMLDELEKRRNKNAGNR